MIRFNFRSFRFVDDSTAAASSLRRGAALALWSLPVSFLLSTVFSPLHADDCWPSFLGAGAEGMQPNRIPVSWHPDTHTHEADQAVVLGYAAGD